MISQREMGRKDQFRRNMSPLTSDLSPQRCRDRSNSPLSRKMVRIPMVAVGELHSEVALWIIYAWRHGSLESSLSRKCAKVQHSYSHRAVDTRLK